MSPSLTPRILALLSVEDMANAPRTSSAAAASASLATIVCSRSRARKIAVVMANVARMAPALATMAGVAQTALLTYHALGQLSNALVMASAFLVVNASAFLATPAAIAAWVLQLVQKTAQGMATVVPSRSASVPKDSPTLIVVHL